MNLRSIDLNLLVVLQALLAERHVTKAAKRIGLSQPALSNALDRLRVLFDDPILVRRGNRFVLSRKAERLADPLNAVLAGVEAVVGLTSQPLAEIRQTVTLTSGDYALAALLPALWQWLQHKAPRLSLQAKPWPGPQAALQMVADGTCDLLVAPLEPLPPKMHALSLRHSAFVGVARPGHPIARRPSRDKFMAFRHVIVSSDGQSPSPIDLVLRRQGIVRDVGLFVPSHMLVPGLVASSDLLGILPADLAAAQKGIVTFKLPFELPGFDGGIVWHERSERDVAVCAVRDAIRDMVRAASAR
jgi:DNA-binding transcriptional LysR family regulator